MDHESYQQEKMAKFILKMRKVRNLTQKDLAEQLGVTDKAVSKWERAVSSPDISLLIPLAKALGVSSGELLSGEKMEAASENKTPATAGTAKAEMGEVTDGEENKGRAESKGGEENKEGAEIIDGAERKEETEALINEALKYSHKSAGQRIKRLWEILFAGVSASFLLAAIVCLICNYAVSGELSWSFIVLASLVSAWGVLAPLFQAQKKRIFKSLLVFSLLIFPYLAVLSFLLHVPLLRTMGMCIAAAAIPGVWGVYAILTYVWGRKKYFALSMICCLMFAEEYGINLIIDTFLKRTPAEQSFHYLEDVIILILAAAFLGVSYFRERRER